MTPTRKQALVAAFLMDGWNLNEELSTHTHRVLECEGQSYGRVWVSIKGYVRKGEVKSNTVITHTNPADENETIEEMIVRGRDVLG